MQNSICTYENKNVKIKICGLFREDDAVAINAALPDFTGFVFYPKSPRAVAFETAKKIKKNLNPKILTVGIFVNEKIENVLKLFKAKIIDIAQLHGLEDKNYIKILKDKSDLKIIKAVKAGSTILLPDNADYFLFDTPDKKLHGGTGKTFDWSLIPNINKPVFLAGGLNHTNIEYAIKTVKPFAIDISSGVETNGRKDFDKILEITKLVRGIKYE